MLHGGFSYCVVGKTLLVIWIMPNGEHGEMFDRTPNKSRIKTKTEREKCSNVQMFTGTIFPHTGAYIIYIGGFYMPRSSPFTIKTKHLGSDISGTT